MGREIGTRLPDSSAQSSILNGGPSLCIMPGWQGLGDMTELITPIRLLAHRLSGAGNLADEDIRAIMSIVGSPRHFAKGATLVEQQEHSDTVWLLGRGWGFRQRVLADGRRQIGAILLPGELTDKGLVMPFGAPDAVVAASEVWAHPIDRDRLISRIDQSRSLERALFYEELTRHAVTREWLLLLSKRTAKERVAYFFFEIFARLNAMGMVHGRVFDLPIAQHEIADMVGLSPVHLNRTLQYLRAQKLLITIGQSVELPNPEALARLAAFNEEMVRIAQKFGRRATASNQGIVGDRHLIDT